MSLVDEEERLWREARIKLLAEERNAMKVRDAVTAQRRAMPHLSVPAERFAFVDSCSKASVSMSDLFGGKSQLIVQHVMFVPGADAACPSCSLWIDGVIGSIRHLSAANIAFVAVSSAEPEKLEAYRQRMGWQELRWFSCAEFGRWNKVSFTEEEKGKGEYNYLPRDGSRFPNEVEMPGISVYLRDADTGKISKTWDAFARGLDPMSVVYSYMDLTPIGRTFETTLPWPMKWIKRHDEYDAPQCVGHCKDKEDN
jgi:predicted dithiol-disulfide oxidoreductase (DUF899 family)